MCHPTAGAAPARHGVPGTPAQSLPAIPLDNRTPARSDLPAEPAQEPLPITQRDAKRVEDGKPPGVTQARMNTACERLHKAFCEALMTHAGAARTLACTEYLACFATEAPHLAAADLSIETAQAADLLRRTEPAEARGAMLAAALQALNTDDAWTLMQASRALFAAAGASVPLATAMRQVFDRARTLPRRQQSVLVNAFMRAQVSLQGDAGLAGLYQCFFAEFTRRFGRPRPGAALSAHDVLRWMPEVLSAVQLHEQGVAQLGAHALPCLARCTAAAPALIRALGLAAHLHGGSTAVGAACRQLAIGEGLGLVERTRALRELIRTCRYAAGVDELHLAAALKAVSEPGLRGTAAGALLVRSVACALGPAGDAQASEDLRRRVREAGSDLDESARQHLETGVDIALDPVRVLQLGAATQAQRLEQLQAVHADADLPEAHWQRLLQAYCALPSDSLREALLREALDARQANADELPQVLAALLPWATAGERGAVADQSMLAAADLLAHAGKLASKAQRQAAGKAAERIEAWAHTILESERHEGPGPRENNVQTKRLRSLRTAAMLLREVAERPAAEASPAARPAVRESKSGGPQQEQPLQASHTTTMSSSSAAQQSPVPLDAESVRVLVYLHARTADPATRAHQLLTLFRDAGVPLDAALCQIARDALAQHPQELAWRENQQGKPSPLAPQYRTLTSRLAGLYEHFLAGGHLPDPRSFLEGELAWAQRMDKPGPGNALDGRLTHVVAWLRERLGLGEPAQVD